MGEKQRWQMDKGHTKSGPRTVNKSWAAGHWGECKQVSTSCTKFSNNGRKSFSSLQWHLFRKVEDTHQHTEMGWLQMQETSQNEPRVQSQIMLSEIIPPPPPNHQKKKRVSVPFQKCRKESLRTSYWWFVSHYHNRLLVFPTFQHLQQGKQHRFLNTATRVVLGLRSTLAKPVPFHERSMWNIYSVFQPVSKIIVRNMAATKGLATSDDWPAREDFSITRRIKWLPTEK